MDRVIDNTGFDDMDMLEKMYDLWVKIQTYCKEQEITDGCVSVTELEMWIQAVMAEGNHTDTVRQSCLRCVVAKATSVREEQEEIESSVVNISPLF